MIKNINTDQKVILIANTSKYLFHYRFLLIKKINSLFKNSFALSPIDKYSNELNKIVKHLPWYLPYKDDFNPIKLINSFLKLFLIVKSIRPSLVHSHTLKPNLLISIINLFLGIKTVISFPGMGRLLMSKGLKKQLFNLILKIIYFTSIYQSYNYIFFKKNPKRVKFIFQNPIDLDFFIKTVNISYDEKKFKLIPGSGVPSFYFKSKKLNSSGLNKNFDFIYCARLEKSKGIKIFISLAEYYPSSRFYIYGELKNNSKDCLSSEEIISFKKRNKNLFFMGYIKDPLLRHHNENTIFLMPSNYGEGLPRGILEAMSLEIPVIATQKACVGLFDNKTLFRVSSNTIDEYKKVIDEIWEKKNEGKLKNFLSNSKEHVKENFEECLIVEKTLQIYKSFDDY